MEGDPGVAMQFASPDDVHEVLRLPSIGAMQFPPYARSVAPLLPARLGLAPFVGVGYRAYVF